MADDGFHEIQLNGKQLVFLFMAATVVAVVIFLCGVMVGRGVPTRAAAAIASREQANLDPTASLGLPATQAVASSDGAPLTAQETLMYPTLLEDPNPPAETLAPALEAAPPPPVMPTAAAVPAPTPVVAAPMPAPVSTPDPVVRSADAALAEPAGSGFVVQVAAVRQREEAEIIARRLAGKGYPAFVTTAGANFRVRVGKFSDRREAEAVAARLEREEQFKPWITR